MNWKNTKLIFRRELSDQLRDRRTMFTIVVMPMVLYPLMGMALLQTAQFMRQEPAKVLVIGSEYLDDSPALIVDQHFNPQLIGGRTDLGLTLIDDEPLRQAAGEVLEQVDSSGEKSGTSPPIHAFLKRSQLDLLVDVGRDPTQTPATTIRLYVNSTSDQSTRAVATVSRIVERWKAEKLRSRLQQMDLLPDTLANVAVQKVDVAPPTRRQAAMWAKLLPFIVLIWALTGAFYPAIDLCAGEKERGTLETLLSSTARRTEIVAGKFLTVATFSFATAILNLLSMTITGLLVISQISGEGAGGQHLPFDLGFPPISTIPWLIVGLVPIVALFSSLALALASFARSSKEGQYYLIPMLMSLVPLMALSMLPSAKLDLGTSLIPVTGMLLLLRSLMLSDYGLAIQFAGPVLAITLVCCWMGARWAVYQFNNESVLFRSGEQFSLGAWLRHVVRDRGPLPTIGEALLCGVIILVIKFFVGLSAELSLTFDGFARQVVISQVATIALPAILMALFLTRGPRETLKLKWPRASYVPAAILIAILLHPGFVALSQVVMYIYPPSEGLAQVQVAVTTILADSPGPLATILVIAMVPAVCEEVAFRGFILSGMQSIRRKWPAIIISALLFGIAHGILQQSIMASFVGVVLGVLAVQTGSLLPCIAYHAMHNALPVLMSLFPAHATDQFWLGYVFETSSSGAIQYTWFASIVMPLFGLGLLVWLWKFSNRNISREGYLPWTQPAVTA
ncbi:MAG: ABC transporter permease subunit/CPBP intramembrane protease [Pirellulaceae bacterium]